MGKLSTSFWTFIKSGMLVSHTIFHYVDIVTDYLLAYQVLQILQLFKEAKRTTWIFLFSTLIVMILLERYKSYHYIKDQLNADQSQIQLSDKTLKESKINQSQPQPEEKNQNQKQEKMSKSKQILFALLLTFTYMDFLYIILFKTSIRDKKNLIKKGIIEMYCENMVFNIIGLIVLQTQIIIGKNITYSVLLSIACSFCSCAYVQYQSYLIRVEQSEQFEEKKNQPFSEFSIETKLFISNPFSIGSLKPTSNYARKFPELYKTSYLQQHLEIQQQSQSKSNIINKLESQSQLLTQPIKLGYIQKFFLLLQLAANVLGMGILVIMQAISNRGTVVNILLIYAFIFYLPQIIIYTALVIKNPKFSKFKTFQKLVGVVIGMPLLAFYGLVLFFIPIKTEQLPFFPKASETWLHNFFPSVYLIVIKQYFMTVWIFAIRDVIFEGKDVYKIGIPTQKNLDNIMDPNSPIRIMFMVALITFLITTISHFLYIIDQIYQIYLKKNPKINQTEQIVILQQKVKDLEKIIKQKNQNKEEQQFDSQNKLKQNSLNNSTKKQVKIDIPPINIDKTLPTVENNKNNNNKTDQSKESKESTDFQIDINNKNQQLQQEYSDPDISIDFADTTVRQQVTQFQNQFNKNEITQQKNNKSSNKIQEDKSYNYEFQESNQILTNRQSEIGYTQPSTNRQHLMSPSLNTSRIQSVYDKEFNISSIKKHSSKN